MLVRPLAACVAVLAILAGVAALSPAHADQPPVAVPVLAANESQIAATGTARVFRKPDFVDINLGVETHETTATAASDAASRAMDAVVKAIRALPIADDNLKTGTISLLPQYEQRDRSMDTSKIVGYAGAIELRIRTSDLSAVSKIIDAALAAGANRINSVEFGIKEWQAAREEAIRRATQSAQRKATVLAEAMSLHVRRALTVSADTPDNRMTSYSGITNSLISVPGAPEGRATDEFVIPGEIEVLAQVNIVYAATP